MSDIQRDRTQRTGGAPDGTTASSAGAQAAGAGGARRWSRALAVAARPRRRPSPPTVAPARAQSVTYDAATLDGLGQPAAAVTPPTTSSTASTRAYGGQTAIADAGAGTQSRRTWPSP